MNIQIMAARRQVAQERLLAAAGTLAERFDLVDAAAGLRGATAKDPAVQRLFEVEATATLLEHMVQATEPATASPPPATTKGKERAAALAHATPTAARRKGH